MTDLLTREITVLDPRTGETVGRVPIATPPQCDAALRKARAAADGWARTPAAERAGALHAAAAVVAGDYNIAPTDDDVWDPALFVTSTHVTPAERKALAELAGLGLHDVVRDRWPTQRVFTYWDYRAGRFHQDLGMRIDLVLAGAEPAGRTKAVWIDRQARKGKGPSDHAPVIVDLDTAPDGDLGPVVPPPSAPAPARRR